MKPFCRGRRRIHFCKINLSKWKPHIHCKDSVCRRIRKLFPSGKISIVKKMLYTGSNPSGKVWIRSIFNLVAFLIIIMDKWTSLSWALPSSVPALLLYIWHHFPIRWHNCTRATLEIPLFSERKTKRKGKRWTLFSTFRG